VELEDSEEEMASAWSGAQENAKDGSASEKRKKRSFPISYARTSIHSFEPIMENGRPVIHRYAFSIHTNTIITRDGKVQSCSGLKLTNIATQASGKNTSLIFDQVRLLPYAKIQKTFSGTQHLPHNMNVRQKQKATASTSNHLLNNSKMRTSEQPRVRASRKIPKRAALTSAGRGVYTFRINGQNYHRIGSLLSALGFQPRYAQLYFFDTHNEVKNRMSAFLGNETGEGVDATIVTSLIAMLDEISAMAKAFRMYNTPTVSEISALITNDFGDNIATRDIMVDSKDGGLKRISELHPSYMALQYPFLFPYGEDGFHEKIPTTTMQEYEKQNVDTLRVDLYHNLNDVVTRGDTHAEGLGKIIVLPRSFIGSPRYMMQNYQDTMALCRAYGNPDLFITFTSNPKWLEITKMLALLPVVYVIEFQKRGLPHAYILLWLKEEWKCTTPTQIDDIISAEIPCPTDDPEGYKVVTEFMLHGPCETIIDEDGYPIIDEEIQRGPQSFKELMTINEILYARFKEACFAYGLLNDDKEWAHAISEASFWALGPQLRDLFVTMLLFCDVSRPLKLWE
nr:DNA helicase PIF1, ATP-dependent [Tanacetum cinerariifolium]